jgi:hypothetical protein
MYRRLPSHFEGGAPHKKMSRSDSGCCCIDFILRRMQLGKLNRKTGTATEAFVGKGGGGNFYGSDLLVSTHWAFRYEIYAKRPTTLFGI